MKKQVMQTVVEALADKVSFLEGVVDDFKDELVMCKEEHARALEEQALAWGKACNEIMEEKKEAEKSLKTAQKWLEDIAEERQEERQAFGVERASWQSSMKQENTDRKHLESELARATRNLTEAQAEVSSLLVQKDKVAALLADRDETITILKASVEVFKASWELSEEENKMLREAQGLGGVIGRLAPPVFGPSGVMNVPVYGSCCGGECGCKGNVVESDLRGPPDVDLDLQILKALEKAGDWPEGKIGTYQG